MKLTPWAIGLVCSLACAAAFAADPINASSSGSVIGDDVLYSIGGGNAVTMGSAGNMDSISVGGGWNNNLVCGNMNLSNTLENQLNGATSGFQNIMTSVLSNATGAVASLPALILQRANPALYNLITNGILQARLDFDRSKGTCRAIGEKMADIAGGQMGWGKIAEGQAMSQALTTNTDAVSTVEQVEKKGGNDGVTWVGGDRAGGSGQQPIRIVGDVTKAGYNLLNKRAATDTSSISKDTCSNGLVCNVWASPQEASTFANRVLGEQQQQTCDSCPKTVTAAGVGLTPLIQETYDTKLQALQDLLTGNKPMSAENLAAASSDSLPITRGVVAALKDERDQDVLARRLASEVALSDVLEKALVLQRTLSAGSKEPNVAANDLALQAVNQQSSSLQQEIGNLKIELDMRQQLAKNSPMTIIDRAKARAENSRGVFQGDPETDRLNQLQSPAKSRQ
ncbi:integrating conjugative element protein [Pseudomonas gingeri NCPPB 3146 = LMG 5327]|uniref:Integrating conjugative element protein n=2 Tax=Pseudomonas gingeri TaxID=117681 RepID=A0A7Y7Y269_9PSED|nr:integrating conjugative element protein [Pseudomonas gingeri]NWA23909.1 integrating conjugative element protein [Pseudomonas gingeri]NWC16569.1 integrating conjugative element protein [Pseudomonas gingeri]PNQ87987.1 integrating conjugative element protein [Pseudomonas gingeri NCPPB 3146 = LMG 5327]